MIFESSVDASETLEASLLHEIPDKISDSPHEFQPNTTPAPPTRSDAVEADLKAAYERMIAEDT